MPPDEENMPEDAVEPTEDALARLRAAMMRANAGNFGSPQYWGVDLATPVPVASSDAMVEIRTDSIASALAEPQCQNCGVGLHDSFYNGLGRVQRARFPDDAEVMYQSGVPVSFDTQLCVHCVIRCDGCDRWTVQEYQSGPASRDSWAERWLHSDITLRGVRGEDRQAIRYASGCLWCGDVCEACSRTYPNQQLHWVAFSSYYDDEDNDPEDEEGWYLCENCTSVCRAGHRYRLGFRCRACNGARQHHRIRGYGYKPDPIFFGNPELHKRLYFGVEHELELQHGQDMDRVIEKLDAIDSAKVLYSKHDGSLDNGIEIVSHPMSLEFWRDEYPWDLWTPGNGLGAHLKSSPHTGIHVHLSKAAFTKGHAYRFAAFHFQNPNFIENIAGRVSNNYTEMRPDFRAGYINYDAPDRYKIDAPHYSRQPMLSHANLQAKGKLQNGSRYWAINAQNPETFELRYFRSTVSRKRLHFYRQWLDAVFAYTQSGWIRTRRPERQLTPYNMRNWLEAQNAGARFDLVLDFMNRDFYATTFQS